MFHAPFQFCPKCRSSALAVAALLACGSGHALEFDTANPDLKVRWDNTFKYSAAARVRDRSPALSQTAFGPTGVIGPNNVNQDDGNNNFSKGLVSNRVDLFSELDVTWRNNWGARVSGAAWYDTVYNRPNDNTTFTANHVPGNEFPSETRKLMGRDVEVLDAFVFGNFDVASRPATARLGRHTLLWGESLFFGSNGIAGGQAPVDLVKLLSVPNSTFKEIARPTGKLSGQVQVSDAVSVGAYYGYEWEPTRLIPVGAYLSTSDVMGPGAERLNAGPIGVFARQPDLEPKNGGQGGMQLRYRADAIDTDFGFYAIRFHPYGPANIYNTLTGFPPALAASSYRWVYHEGARSYGASFAKSIGEWGFAGEVSIRDNMPLSSSGATVLSSIGVGTNLDNRDNPGYAVGRTGHAQVSWLASLGPNPIWREASFLGEVAWNTRMKVTRGEAQLNPNADRSAASVRMVLSPTYRQVFPGLDLTPSVGASYTAGKSSAVGPGFGVDKGGDFTIGLTGVYLNRWVASINYVQFYGPEGSALDNNNNVQFMQALKDRNFVSVSLRTTF
ncbi:MULTISPECIES: DUF1302 domain-containing protein [Ramlibacter]|uniref:DUF1302 family protein n=1 Tax=Ramlibacter pinisoli TaxID=2682844 RepID=A0A6N8ILX9_9BURK|nr:MULTISPECIES: DUF1302 domain-containing protein [Ramlibacter]MBA2960497.1 DUF1302 domain-containing protein [Ramlibacter sp. CGMCC 1.13660]MVQ27829.1 DUF1302 family protein [Ramlibacter pinisoli]